MAEWEARKPWILPGIAALLPPPMPISRLPVSEKLVVRLPFKPFWVCCYLNQKLARAQKSVMLYDYHILLACFLKFALDQSFQATKLQTLKNISFIDLFVRLWKSSLQENKKYIEKWIPSTSEDVFTLWLARYTPVVGEGAPGEGPGEDSFFSVDRGPVGASSSLSDFRVIEGNILSASKGWNWFSLEV